MEQISGRGGEGSQFILYYKTIVRRLFVFNTIPIIVGRGFIGYPKGRNRDIKLVN